MATNWRLIVGTTAFVVPVTVTFMDKVACVTKVEGVSMQPVLNPQYDTVGQRDYVLQNKWAASDFNFNRGDIVTFRSPMNPKQSFIKRIIGLEGDLVKMKRTATIIKIPDGHCWVEGENSAKSLDSNVFGPISLSLIHSKATHVVWPPARWQKLEFKEVESDRVQKRTDHKTHVRHKHIV